MAAAFVVFGCLLGFIGALCGWLFAGLPLVAALAIWTLSGPLTALVLVFRALPPQTPAPEPATAQVA